MWHSTVWRNSGDYGVALHALYVADTGAEPVVTFRRLTDG